MAIFEGAVKGLGSLADKLGFGFITGNIPVHTNAPVYVGFQIPEENSGLGSRIHSGGFFLNVPNHSAEFGEMAINMAQEALVIIELAVVIQTITDPKGGIKIKDALDPYHYNVVKNALEENNEPVPAPKNPGATLLTKLGGSIVETGLLSGIAGAADAMQVAGYFSDFLKITPQLVNPGFPPGGQGIGPISFSGAGQQDILTQVAGAFPSYSYAINIMNSAIAVKTLVMQYIISLIRNSIDTTAGALLLKNVLDDFSVSVSQNALEKSNRPTPDATVQEGQEGIF